MKNYNSIIIICFFTLAIFIEILLLGCQRKSISINGKWVIGSRDSQFVIYTVKEFSKFNWDIFNDHSKMYKIKNNQIDYFIGKLFYNQDSSKLIAWVGEKMYNAPTIKEYSLNIKDNRICPTAGDTVINMYVLIGYRTPNSNKLKLYPWGNRQTPCYDSINNCIKELEEYYFKEIKNDYLVTVSSIGKQKGLMIKTLYKYSIIEKEFWTKGPLWKKDNIGSNNLYPFEVNYNNVLSDTCYKCSEKINYPLIVYPDSIISQFLKSQ